MTAWVSFVKIDGTMRVLRDGETPPSGDGWRARPATRAEITDELAARRAGQSDKPLRFVHDGKAVYYGSRTACHASTVTLARRIANALNRYTPGERGY